MDLTSLPLGLQVAYPRHYDASLLFAIPRALGRHEIGVDAQAQPFVGLPFVGFDRWYGY